MKVSIITPTFNSINYIEETYNSILSQKGVHWEWLITDDCSTDGTWEFFLDVAKRDKRVKIIRNEVNSGAAVSRNIAISRANNKYIAFIDSDDLWENNKLEKQLSYMIEKKLAFSFTAFKMVDDNGKNINKIVDGHLLKPLSYNDMLLKKATLGCSTVILDKSKLPDLYMPLIRTGQDYALWLKLLKTGILAYPIKEPLTRYRIVPNSISRNKFKKACRQWFIYRKIENLNFFHSIFCFSYYAWRAVFRK